MPKSFNLLAGLGLALFGALACGLFALAPAFAADLPNPKAAPVPIYTPAPPSWTGLYFGVSGGYAFELRADHESRGL